MDFEFFVDCLTTRLLLLLNAIATRTKVFPKVVQSFVTINPFKSKMICTNAVRGFSWIIITGIVDLRPTSIHLMCFYIARRRCIHHGRGTYCDFEIFLYVCTYRYVIGLLLIIYNRLLFRSYSLTSNDFTINTFVL